MRNDEESECADVNDGSSTQANDLGESRLVEESDIRCLEQLVQLLPRVDTVDALDTRGTLGTDARRKGR